MSEDQKKQLQQQLWNIANTLRGKMDADEFRDYIPGFILQIPFLQNSKCFKSIHRFKWSTNFVDIVKKNDLDCFDSMEINDILDPKFGTKF
jgi:hypothetical protein